jgi:beta-phosphoglucomutase
MIQGFIFDLDGVITDTAEFHYRAWKRLADELGIPFSRQENEALRGIPRRESLLLLLKGRTLPEEQILDCMERKNDYYLEYIREINSANLLPGSIDLLHEIRSAGLKCAIGSASKNTCEVLERLGILELFDAIADGNSVERQKPEPDLFLFAASVLKLPPSAGIVVEDAAAGIEAALRGGFHIVGIGPRGRVGAAEKVFSSLDGVKLAMILDPEW